MYRQCRGKETQTSIEKSPFVFVGDESKMVATHSTSTPIGMANVLNDFLKLYLNPPTDDLAIIENKTTLELAKQIKYKRILELQTGLHGSAVVKPRPKFRGFFAELASEKIRFYNNAGNWASACKHVLVFLGDDNPTIQEIDDIWLEEFRAYLLEVDKRSGKPRLSSSTALSYFNRVRTALTTAYERRIIERNPANLARPIRAENVMREFLTLNEVKRLVETKCDQPVLKDLFRCLKLKQPAFSLKPLVYLMRYCW